MFPARLKCPPQLEETRRARNSWFPLMVEITIDNSEVEPKGKKGKQKRVLDRYLATIDFNSKKWVRPHVAVLAACKLDSGGTL